MDYEPPYEPRGNGRMSPAVNYDRREVSQDVPNGDGNAMSDDRRPPRLRPGVTNTTNTTPTVSFHHIVYSRPIADARLAYDSLGTAEYSERAARRSAATATASTPPLSFACAHSCTSLPVSICQRRRARAGPESKPWLESEARAETTGRRIRKQTSWPCATRSWRLSQSF